MRNMDIVSQENELQSKLNNIIVGYYATFCLSKRVAQKHRLKSRAAARIFEILRS